MAMKNWCISSYPASPSLFIMTTSSRTCCCSLKPNFRLSIRLTATRPESFFVASLTIAKAPFPTSTLLSFHFPSEYALPCWIWIALPFESRDPSLPAWEEKPIPIVVGYLLLSPSYFLGAVLLLFLAANRSCKFALSRSAGEPNIEGDLLCMGVPSLPECDVERIRCKCWSGTLDNLVPQRIPIKEAYGFNGHAATLGRTLQELLHFLCGGALIQQHHNNLEYDFSPNTDASSRAGRPRAGEL